MTNIYKQSGWNFTRAKQQEIFWRKQFRNKNIEITEPHWLNVHNFRFNQPCTCTILFPLDIFLRPNLTEGLLLFIGKLLWLVISTTAAWIDGTCIPLCSISMTYWSNTKNKSCKPWRYFDISSMSIYVYILLSERTI